MENAAILGVNLASRRRLFLLEEDSLGVWDL